MILVIPRKATDLDMQCLSLHILPLKRDIGAGTRFPSGG